MLDLGVVLPAMVLTGVLLRRGRPLGHLLAVPLLAFGMAMGVAIVGMFVSLALAGGAAATAPAVMIVLIVLFETAALLAFARHLRPEVHPAHVVRSSAPSAPRPDAAARSDRTKTHAR